MALGRLTLGEILLRNGYINNDQLHAALAEQTQTGLRLGETLRRMGLVSDSGIARALAEQLDIDFVDLDETPPAPDCILCLPREVALEYGALPVFTDRDRLVVAVRDPYDIRVDVAVRDATGSPVRLAVAPENQLREALLKYYGDGGESLIIDPATIVSEDQQEESDGVLTLEQVSAAGLEVPIIRMVNSILVDGIRRGASDIHLEPQEGTLRVRFRIDGRLRVIMNMRFRQHLAVAARLKVMTGMDIAESRKPQDGGCHFRVDGQGYDLRMSTLPSVHGETVVIRVLKNARHLLQLDSLGMSPAILNDFRRLLAQREGVLLVTGPTGSGKTTTLYAALDHLVSDEVKVITVEDPVEVKLTGVTQVSVNERAGRTYASTLRSMLRQDPDILMVGEIRDGETAEMACRAALTGHLVLSTLHTRDAIGSFSRLIDMGIQRHVLCASLNGALAQRLLARNCPQCVKDHEPTPRLRKALEMVLGSMEGVRFRKGAGCVACNRLGVRGRIGVYELMTVDETLREMISAGATMDQIRGHCRVRGFRTMEETAFEHVRSGVIPPEEIEALGMRVALAAEGQFLQGGVRTAALGGVPISPLVANGGSRY